MPLDLRPFERVGLSEDLIRLMLAEHERDALPRLDRLWAYYRNPMSARAAEGPASGGWYRVAQEDGLPARLRGRASGVGFDDRAPAPEVVIENDVAWRIDALVDFVFGKPLRIRSTARDAGLRAVIDRALEAMLEASGGMRLLQDAALLGAVHGWVDFVLRTDGLASAALGSDQDHGRAVELARRLRIEIVEAARGVALLDPSDYRRIDAYVIRSEQEGRAVERASTPGRRALAGLLGRRSRTSTGDMRVTQEALEILSADHRQVYVDERLVEEGPNPLGVLPVAHVQNTSQPFRYAGLSDVEPLIPLQDELNTRLSDRAHRVTLQSFNMYLAKGLDADGTGVMPVAPGQIWTTNNPDASIEAFGGDGYSPSEDKHIEDVRESMDKVSSVSPVVLGVVRAKLGHLSSANALRITMLGVLSKMERKRLAYGSGVTRLCELALHALDAAGALRTEPEDRGVQIRWPDPLPVTEEERLRTAQIKRDLGVPVEALLEELGYSDSESSVN